MLAGVSGISLRPDCGSKPSGRGVPAPGGRLEPELIDMAGRDRRRMQAVDRDLMGVAGEADRP